jgi:hypothetical protein
MIAESRVSSVDGRAIAMTGAWRSASVFMSQAAWRSCMA